MSTSNNSDISKKVRTNKGFWSYIPLILGLGIAIVIAIGALLLIDKQKGRIDQLQVSLIELDQKLTSLAETNQTEKNAINQSNQELLDQISQLNEELAASQKSLKTSIQNLATLQHANATGDKSSQDKIFGGIGIQFKFNRAGNLIIEEVLKNTPAHNQLYIDDVITKIDDRAVTGLTAAEVTDLIRGNVGDEVTIEFIPAGQIDASSKVTLVRALINASRKSEKPK